jgi:hypothetical protein
MASLSGCAAAAQEAVQISAAFPQLVPVVLGRSLRSGVWCGEFEVPIITGRKLG